MATQPQNPQINLEDLAKKIEEAKQKALQIGSQIQELAKQQGKEKEIAQAVPLSSREIDASQVVSSPKVAPIIPTITGTQANSAAMAAYDLSAGYEARAKTLAESIKAAQEALNKIQEARGGLLREFFSSLTAPRPSLQETIQQVYQQFNLPQNWQELQQTQQEILALRKQLADLDAEEAEALAQIEQKPIPMVVIDNEKRAIQERYERRRSALAAQLSAYAAYGELLQNNFDTARQFAQQAIAAATYDEEWNYRRLQAFFEANRDYLNDLEEKERRDLQNLLAMAEDNYNNALNEKRAVMELVLKYPQADWPKNWHQLTLDEAVNIAKKASATSPILWPEGAPSSYKEWVLAGMPGTYEEWLMQRQNNRNQIMSAIGAELEKRRGSDGWVNPKDYQRALEVFLNAGAGSIDDFVKEFPVGLYVGPHEYANLPDYLKPENIKSAITTTSTLSPIMSIDKETIKTIVNEVINEGKK